MTNVMVVILMVVMMVGCPNDVVAPDCDPAKNWRAYQGNPVFPYLPTALDGALGDPSVLPEGSGYVMYYAAVQGDFTDPLVRIFLATSADGVVWRRTGVPVFLPAASGWDSTNVDTPYVLRRQDGTLAMYYSGNSSNSDVGFQIGLATSTDGINWTRVGTSPILATTAEEISLIGPSVVYDPDAAEYVMLYGAINDAYTVDIRRATSQDGTQWTRQGVVLRMDQVERQNTDDLGVMGPELLKTANGFEMVYNSLLAPNVKGGMPRSGGIYYARSADGQTWTKFLPAVYLPTGGNKFDAIEVGAQSWLRTDVGYRLWYVGTNTDYSTYYDNGIGLLELLCP